MPNVHLQTDCKAKTFLTANVRTMLRQEIQAATEFSRPRSTQEPKWPSRFSGSGWNHDPSTKLLHGDDSLFSLGGGASVLWFCGVTKQQTSNTVKPVDLSGLVVYLKEVKGPKDEDHQTGQRSQRVITVRQFTGQQKTVT